MTKDTLAEFNYGALAGLHERLMALKGEGEGWPEGKRGRRIGQTGFRPHGDKAELRPLKMNVKGQGWSVFVKLSGTQRQELQRLAVALGVPLGEVVLQTIRLGLRSVEGLMSRAIDVLGTEEKARARLWEAIRPA